MFLNCGLNRRTSWGQPHASAILPAHILAAANLTGLTAPILTPELSAPDELAAWQIEALREERGDRYEQTGE